MNQTAKDISVQLPINPSFVFGFNVIRGADESDGRGYLCTAIDLSILCFGVQ